MNDQKKQYGPTSGFIVLTAFRNIKERFLETIIVILGLSLGVGIISTALGLANNFQSQAGPSNYPYMRQIRVQPKMNSYEWDKPVWKIGTETTPEIIFSFEEMMNIKAQVDAVTAAWIEMGYRFNLGASTRFMERPRTAPVQEQAKDTKAAVAGADGDAASIPGATREPTAQQEPLENEREFPVDNFPGRFVTPDYFKAYDLEIGEGSFFTMQDVREKNRVLVIGKNLKEKLYGDEAVIGERIVIEGLACTIIGVLKPDPHAVEGGASDWGPDNTAFAPLGTAPHMPFLNEIRNLTFATDEAEDVEAAVAGITDYFEYAYGEDLVTIRSSLDSIRASGSGFNSLLWAIAFFSGAALLIASINILNLMLARVVRRNKAGGILKALGANKMHLFRQFFAETILIGFGGGLIGCGMAFLLSNLLWKALMNANNAANQQIPQFITGPVLLSALGITLILTLIFGVYPAYKASRVSAVDAIRNG